MKKKVLVLLLSTILLLTACGNTESSSPTPPDSISEESTITESVAETSETFSELDTMSKIDVEENLFSVELTIPADYVGETTQEELNSTASEYGYKSITLNSDGSATYIMTKEQHKTMMDEMAISLNGTLDDLITSGSYPNFTDIKANNNFTEFIVTTKSKELDLTESFSVIVFYMYGGMYNVFNGTTVDNVSVTFINADTGEIISTSNSSDIEK